MTIITKSRQLQFVYASFLSSCFLLSAFTLYSPGYEALTIGAGRLLGRGFERGMGYASWIAESLSSAELLSREVQLSLTVFRTPFWYDWFLRVWIRMSHFSLCVLK